MLLEPASQGLDLPGHGVEFSACGCSVVAFGGNAIVHAITRLKPPRGVPKASAEERVAGSLRCARQCVGLPSAAGAGGFGGRRPEQTGCPRVVCFARSRHDTNVDPMNRFPQLSRCRSASEVAALMSVPPCPLPANTFGAVAFGKQATTIGLRLLQREQLRARRCCSQIGRNEMGQIQNTKAGSALPLPARGGTAAGLWYLCDTADICLAIAAPRLDPMSVACGCRFLGWLLAGAPGTTNEALAAAGSGGPEVGASSGPDCPSAAQPSEVLRSRPVLSVLCSSTPGAPESEPGTPIAMAIDCIAWLGGCPKSVREAA